MVMKIIRLACYSELAGISEGLNPATVLASGENLSLPEPGILLIVGSVLMAFAFYRRIRKK